MTRGALGWAGQMGWPAGLRQVSPGEVLSSLLFNVSVFYYFCNCWALLKISRHFQKS